METSDLDFLRIQKRNYDQKHNHYQERKELRKKYDKKSYYFFDSKPNKRLRNAIRSKINNLTKSQIEIDAIEILMPRLECKKCMTWWDCGPARHHKII